MEALVKITYGLMIALIFLCSKCSDALCNTEKRFGQNCEFVCHCLYGQQCANGTGHCPNGCDFDWVGPGCQRRNLARSQNGTLVIQASIKDLKQGPHLATDRNLDSCSRTQDASRSKVTPWWRIWFPYRHIITHITILTENAYRDQFENFTVMIENVTDENRENNGQFDPITCYKHANTVPTSPQINVACDSSIAGNQIRIKLAHTKLTLALCDVRIYGECEDRTFDDSCTDKGSPYCLEACDKDDKTCSACAPGWTGNRCDKMCSNGTYGKGCMFTCSGNCKDNVTCRKVDGKCVEGCNIGYDGETCDQIGLCNKENRFGQNCDFVCHCMDGQQCASSTGNCLHDCDFDWIGPGCQRKNIARVHENTLVKQSSNRSPYHNPQWAVDKILTTCSKTQYASISQVTPWWRIWLPQKHRIRKISILTGDYYTDQFRNFTVMVENVTHDRRTNNTEFNPITCYRHGNYVPTSTKINVVCDKIIVGNQIRIKLAHKKLTLALCDVRIYGECEDGTYGYNCANKCSPNCQDVCDKDNGSCDYCAPGWEGSRCDQECEDGRYGRNCALNCSGNCRNNTVCSKADGNCRQGCSDGYVGIMCNESCISGQYGPNCSQNCSGHCSNDSVCRFTDGVCLSGCAEGWTGNICDEPCIRGQYGPDCSQNCSGHCTNDTVCRFTDGICFTGCKNGWTGSKCDEECREGTYGQECANNCSRNCLNGSSCTHINGTCENGCDPGWTGETCNEVCMNGTYGLACSLACSIQCSNMSLCRHTDGHCMAECKRGWTGVKCDEEIVSEAEKQSGLNSVTIGVSAGVTAISLIIVTLGLILCWKRKSLIERFPALQMWKKNHSKRDENSINSMMFINEHEASEGNDQNTDPVYANSSPADIHLNGLHGKNDISDCRHSTEACSTRTKHDEQEYIQDIEYYNVTPTRQTPHAVSISELSNFMKEKCEIAGYFQSEFETISTEMLHPVSAAKRSRNIHKNRFKMMYPYDHSRVKLQVLPGQPDSDYINASYINGYIKDKAYIASQGPTKDNVNDFWRMIWEVDVRTVVMVTNFIENGKMKCMKYWDPEDDTLYGKIHVKLQCENVYADFTIRKFSLYHQDDQQIKRDVTQFNFTAWPDHGVPETSNSLLHFWRKVRQNDEYKTHTWLVHCSAGVGRTGTFLAMDILFDQGEQMDFIDVYQCVKDLREQRVKMVQTHEQYKFLYVLMTETFVLPSKPIRVDDILTQYEQLRKKDSKSGKSNLFIEYEALRSTMIGPKRRTTKAPDNRNTDNYADSDELRPKLSTFFPGCTDFIQATYVPSYFDLREFIIAQWNPEYKMETCRLIFENGIELVVTISADQRNNVSLETSDSDNDQFLVTCQSRMRNEDYTMKDHEIQNQSKKHRFKEIVFESWASKRSVPESQQAMLNLVTEVNRHRQTSPDFSFGIKSILFQCANSVDRAGLMTVIMNVMDRANVDNEVSIPQVVRQLRHCRRELIQNFEQYKFCYDVLNCHLESNATYANV